MFPWFWFWAPQLHLPLSGDVAQRIDPSLIQRLYFQGIPAAAGDADIEQAAATDVASYGTQLGWLTDVVLALAQQQPAVAQGPAKQALQDLTDASATIETLKTKTRARRAKSFETELQQLKASGSPEYDTLAPRLRKLLGEG